MLDLDPAHAAVLRRHVEAETAFDIDGTLATLAPDCVFEDVPTGERYCGHEAVRRYYGEWWSAFRSVPKGKVRYVPAGDCLIAETRFVGQHVGVYRGIAATHRPIDLPMAIFVSFRDGLMQGERFYYDRATLMAQVGVA